MTNDDAEKNAIRELLATYCFHLDNYRFADMAALFTEDGVWDTAFGKGSGGFDIGDVIQRGQGVERGVGPSHAHGTSLAGSSVEEHGGTNDPAPEGIKAAPIKVGSLILLV